MLATLAVLGLLASPPALAGEDEANSCLRTKVWDGYADGWGIRTMTSTTLADGKTRSYLVTLYAGNEYQITTCADEAVKNLDVLLYDTQGNVVSRDDTEDREPKITIKPPATGTYYIVLYNRQAASAETSGGVAMAVVYR